MKERIIMINTREEIVKRFENLEDIDGVDVEISNGKKTVYVKYRTVRSLDFKFVWSNDHFIGYFTDENGNQSQAVISIWEPIEAINFIASYSILIDLRAGRK